MAEPLTIIIDDQEVACDPAMTLLQACEQIGLEVPRFCYHERLSIAGNCRMCLVEIVGGPPKPVASCAMQVRDLRPGAHNAPPEIRTRSKMVKKAREGVMEFLLINHPLDCPICDQGGECDLQDQAMAYGIDFSRYSEVKRAVEDIDLGPLVETHMTRCISCTRCVRFTTEVAGITQMGQTGRGEDAEITTYLGQTLKSNLQGNIIDLCPVGALVSKPYAFTARPWELRKTETIDVMDGLGANIRVDCKGRNVMRILPRNHDDINEEWISDKTRFVWDGLRRQRLDQPYIRGKDGKLVPTDWHQALSTAANALKMAKMPLGLVGDLAPLEAVFALSQLMAHMGGQTECRVDGTMIPTDSRAAYAGTCQIKDIDEAETILLIGTNPVDESPILNARIRKAWTKGANIALIGQKTALTYPYSHWGDEKKTLETLSARRLSTLTKTVSIIILGVGACQGKDGVAVVRKAMELADKTSSGFMMIHMAASRVGALDIGAVSAEDLDNVLKKTDVIYNLGADEIELARDGRFVIYQGSHGDRGAHQADVILPAAAYTEESGLFVNMEGRPQLAQRATFAPGLAKENWAILRALSGYIEGKTLGYDSLDAVRAVLVEKHPHLGDIGEVAENKKHLPKTRKKIEKGKFTAMVKDFYLTNPIARASEIMAKLSSRTQVRSKDE